MSRHDDIGCRLLGFLSDFSFRSDQGQVGPTLAGEGGDLFGGGGLSDGRIFAVVGKPRDQNASTRDDSRRIPRVRFGDVGRVERFYLDLAAQSQVPQKRAQLLPRRFRIGAYDI